MARRPRTRAAIARDAAALLDLASLDWSVFERDRPWDSRTSPAEGIRAGDALREQVARLHPDWPSPRERRDDAACHLRVIGLLERASRRRR
jgi:hypothetical protein